MLRYMIRKEYFGAYVYDSKERMYLLFDWDSFEIFENIKNDIQYYDRLSDDVKKILQEEEFMLGGQINFYIVNNGICEEGVLSAPMRLHLLYTNTCNLNCIHCFSKTLSERKQNEMTFDDKVKILDEMKKIGICEILIGGGEPFVKDDIYDFIFECNKRDIVVKIFTNGLLFAKGNFDKILNADIAYLAISVDGTTNEEYAVTRGIEGLDTVKDVIKKLKREKCRYPILVSTTINHFNCKNPQEYLDFMMETGADRLKIRATKPNGNINENRDVMIAPDKYLDFLVKIQSLYNLFYKNKFKLDITWGDFRLYFDEETQEIKVLPADLPYEQYGCVAGKTAMCINADGIGTPCGFLPDDLQPGIEDNVIKKSILEVWQQGTIFTRLRHIEGNSECINCEEYTLCRGGCIARIRFSGQEINGIDPWCIKKYFPIEVTNVC